MTMRLQEAIARSTAQKAEMAVNVLSGVQALIGASGERWTQSARSRPDGELEVFDEMSAEVVERADLAEPWPYSGRAVALEALATQSGGWCRGNPFDAVAGAIGRAGVLASGDPIVFEGDE